MALRTSSVIPEIIVLEGFQIVIQFIDQRNAGGDIQSDDIRIRNIVQIFDQRPQTIAVGGDNHFFPDLRAGRRLHASRA